MNEGITRRLFLVGATGVVLAACADDGDTSTGSKTTSESDADTDADESVEFTGDIFTLGVASGDALSDRVILWTRLAVDPMVPGGGMGSDNIPIVWEVADDDSFNDIVASGTATAPARFAHAVHVDAEGLRPGRSYAYRFRVGGQTSPVGHTATLPKDGVDQFSFVLAACQDPQGGEYGAWREIAERDDVDAVVFTGDYIYDLPPIDSSPARDGRRMWASPPPADLDGFRLRYSEVKSDPSLRAAHASVPWFVMWDDHEIADNYWSDGFGKLDFASGEFEPRRSAAYQAWWEHQPVRVAAPRDGELDVYRSVRIGDLVELFIIDTHQYADEPPCRDTSTLDHGPACSDRDDPDRSLLGPDQEKWLLRGLRAADTTWTGLVSPVMFSGLDDRDPGETEPMYHLQSWDGYPAARDRVADALESTSNPVVLSGDTHASFAFDVGPGFGRDQLAPEFMSTAISSAPVDYEVLPDNPHIRHLAPENGYLLCVVDADTWTAEYRSLTDVWDPSSPVETTATLVVDADSPEIRPV